MTKLPQAQGGSAYKGAMLIPREPEKMTEFLEAQGGSRQKRALLIPKNHSDRIT